MFSQIEQIFSHISRTRFAAFFILMLALPIAARAQEVTIKSSPTSIMEGNRATFIISVTPAPTRNLRVNIEVRGNVFPNNYTRPTTITVGTSGQATLTVLTRDFTENPDDENWGSVSVTIKEGTGYTIGHWGYASVHVIDDEANENPPATVSPLPVVSLHTDRTRVAIGDEVTFTIKRTTPHDKRHRVDFRTGGHLPDITEWQPMVTILHPQSANRHSPGERSYSFRVQEEACGHTQGRKIEAFLLDAYYYGDNIPQGADTGDTAYKVGDPSSVTIDVYAPPGWQPTGAPTISGTLDVDEVLTVSHDLSGVTNIQWIRVQGSTETNIGTGNTTYTIVSADNDHRLKVKVTFNDGTCEIESALTGVVGGETPVGTIVGNPPSITEGQFKRFKITMNPAPTAPLNAEVRVRQIGDFITDSPGVGTHIVNFSTNQATATITVNTENDQVDELDGEISVELLSRTGYKVGNPAIATVIVKDNDNPRMKIEAVTTPVTEGDDAEFTITADPVPATPLTVTVSVTETRNFISGTPPSTVNFTPDQATATLTVATDNDNIDELDGQIRAQLQSGTDYTTGSPSSATVTVNDNDMPQLSIGADQTVAESAGSMEFTVTLDGPNAQTVTVDYATSDDTAIAPGDYTQRSGRLTFSPSGARTQTIRVTIRNDDIDENNENFTVTLSNENNATIGDDEATGTITDDDERGVRVDPTALNVPENGNNTYTVVLTSQPTDNVTVTVGGATGDVSVIGSPLIFTTGNWRNPKTVRVNADDDSDSTSDPPVTLTHTVSGGDYTGEAAASVTVTIVENDISTLSIDNASASESAGTVSFTVRLSVASTQPVTVTYATSNGTAIAPGDYTADNGTLTFPASSTTPQTISVTIENDDIDEDNETFTVTLSNASSNAMLAGGGSTLSATGTIQDNDTRGVRVSPTTLTVNEGDNNTYTVQLLSEPTNTVAIGVSVTDNPDVSVDKPSLTFTTNTWNTAQTVTVEADQDTDSANDAATVQHMVSGGDYGNVTAASVRVTVDDDETPGPPIQQPPQPPTQQPPTQQPIQPPTPGTLQVTITADTSPVTEGTAATFTITASSAPTTDLTVSVNVSETEDVISGTPDATVTINANESTATLTVATDDDNVAEEAGVVTAQVQAGTGYTVGTPSSASVTVNDNDGPGTKGPPLPEMTITANRASVTEGTTATFTVTADPAPTTALKVRVNVTQTGKVLSGTPPSTITFNAKQTTATLTVATDDDNADEVASEVTAQLQSGTGYTVGTPSSASVTVNDNDIPQMTITADTSPVTEGTAATFTIGANPVPATALTVNVNVTQTGDVLSGTPASTVSFNANQSTATLTVATDDDDVRETAGTVMAQITAGVGYTLGTPSSASVTVNDDDTPPNHPATGAPIIIGKPELRETLTADVSNIRDANGLTNVTYAYQWIRVMDSVEMEIPGATGSTYEVAIDDSGYQLKVRVNFTDDLGYPEELESALTAMVVIPGVTPVITITADPPSVTEGTAATFTITATPAPTITLTVKVNVTETANTLSGTPPSTVTISANQTTLTVATDDDKTDEHASVVTARVRAGMGYVVGTPSSARVLVLDDDLPPAIDATLSSLTINPGVLTPAFAPGTLSYTALVPNATSTVTVTATPKNPDATVSINGQNATTSDLPFTGDTLNITVMVTAVDNITQLTYTITVNRAPTGIPQVTITAHPTTVTEGTPATFTITANQPSVTDLTVNVKVTETAKTLSGTPPSTVTISAGYTTATLTVATDDDDVDEHASMVKAQLQAGTGYTVGDPSSASVIVLDDEVTISTDATLSSLTINPGALNPAFDPETFTYTASVPNADSTITVTTIPNNEGATISLNGQNTTSLDIPFTGDTLDITITVTAEDNSTQLTYTITVTRQEPIPNRPATGAPTISGTPEVGEILTADVSNIADADGLENVAYTYQWIRVMNGEETEIPNATSSTYEVVTADIGHQLKVRVNFTDDAGHAEELESALTSTVAAPVVTPVLAISANPTTITEGTAATFTITATPAPTTALTVNLTITETGDVISGTPPSTVTISTAETTLTVATDDDNVDEDTSAITALLQAGTGYTVGDPSSASVTVNDNDAAPNSPATGAPTIIGTPEVGEKLTADVSNIRDADGLENVTYTYQWIRVMGGVETEIPNATSSTYEVATADIGHQIKVRVNFTDDLGHAEELESELTSTVITPVVPVLTISANTTSVTEGTAATFTITATPAPTTALIVNVNITQTEDVLSGTPASTISFNAGQTTATLTVATDDDNVDEEASAVTAALQTGTGYTVGDPSSASVTVEDNDVPPNSPATGAPTIIGTPEVSQTLTVDVSNIQDADGLENVVYTYQWIRVLGGAETEIIGAAGTTYEVATTDIDHQLKVRVNFTDDAGQAEELESALTSAVVAPEAPVPVKLDAWLARFGRVASDHVIATVRERARGHVGTDHVIIGGYNLDQMNYDGLFYNPAWMPDPFQMRYGGDASENERRKELIKQIVSSTSFARSGKFGGPYSEPRWAVWGRGAVTRFSGTDDGQTVEGDVTSVMLGIDYGDNCFQSGLVLSYSIGDGILGSIANLRDEWSVETTLTGLYPWARLSVTNRLSIWGLLGYAGGDMPLSLEGIREIETGANMTMGAIGVRSDLVGSSWHDGFSLALASDAVISRAHSDALTDFRAYTGSASRVRVLLEGSHVLWICGGSLHPLAELGMRYDGGDVDTGLGIEIGGGMRYVLTSLGLMIEGRARGLIAHQDGNYKEWGGSGTIRLSPKPSGEGLSMRLSPTWGNASGSARTLWSRPDMSDIASGRSTGLYSSNPVSAEVAYGMPVFGDKLMATPFVGLQGDYKRLGLGLHRGSLFGVAVEGLQNNRDLALRVRAGMRTHHVILRLEGSLDTYGHQAYFRLQRDM